MTGPARCSTISRKLQYLNLFVVFSLCRVVLNASALPDPREVDYDVLLLCVLFPERSNLATDTPAATAAGSSHILTFMVCSLPR